MDDHISAQLVAQARAGDQAALDELITQYLPLVYNIVGRALIRSGDVDDVVQNTMLAVVRGIGALRDPASFRSWLVAITMNQLRNHAAHQPQAPTSSLDDASDLADPGADFVDLTLLQLGLSGQRREVVLATRWLDPDDRHLLSLWWLETAGELTRVELAGACELDPHHATVRLARMKNQLETARIIVRALMESPRCLGLQRTAEQWRGQETPLWRKRFARHIRECPFCTSTTTDLIPAERLLAGLALVPIPVGYTAYMLTTAHHASIDAAAAPRIGQPTTGRARASWLRSSGRHGAAHAKLGFLSPKPLLAAVVPLVVGGGVAVAAVYPTPSGTPSSDVAPKRLSSAPSTGGTPSQPETAGPADPGTPTPPSTTSTLTNRPSQPHTSNVGNSSNTPAPSRNPRTTSPTPAPPATSPSPNDPDVPYYNNAIQQVLKTMNDARAKVGVPPLTLIPGLNNSASIHTQLMVNGCGLNHVCPGESDIGYRFHGVSWPHCAGENIGEGGASDTGSSITGMAVGLTLGMLAEKAPNDGHKWNILTKDHTGVGIAVFRDSHGKLWMTQDFVG